MLRGARRRAMGGKPTTEQCDRLDLANFTRGGWLQPGMVGRTQWVHGATVHSAIGWRVLGTDGIATALELNYVMGHAPIRTVVPIVWTACRFGGQRPWLRCPAIGCGRRVRVLYGRQVFCCRSCHDLAYASTRERPAARALRAAQRIRTRLGGTANVTEPFPAKPKGMQWRTYWRLRQQAEATEGTYRADLDAWLERQATGGGRDAGQED
ncbi:MAG: hypothetical protein ACM3U2_15270 [Deltaproteobacteria bacterium]